MKMLFPTQEKADNFIRFNADEISENNEKTPVRSYFCPACGGWHVTHKELPGFYARTDKMNEEVYRLGVFVSSLKKDFDKKDWEKWKNKMDKFRPYLTRLKRLSEHRLFLLEAERQFEHFDKMVAAGEKEDSKKYNKILNEINAERKSLVVDIREKMNDLAVEKCMGLAVRLDELMQIPAFEGTEEKIKEECQLIVSCFLDEEKAEKLKSLVANVNFLKGRMNYIPTADLVQMCSGMEEDFFFIAGEGQQVMFLQELKRRIKKIRKYVNGRTGEDETEPYEQKALRLLDNHFQCIRQYLIDAVTALQEGKNGSAVEWITMADNRMKALPMSVRKIEMMKYLTAVAEKTDWGGKVNEIGG